MMHNTDSNEIVGFTPYPVEHVPVAVKIGEESLILRWSDGHESEFHYLWLRDNCPCLQCVTSLSREQIFEICDVPVDIRPQGIEISSDQKLLIDWNYQQHRSHYHPGWLRAHCYSDAARKSRQWQPEIWDGARIFNELPNFQFQSVMQDDKELLSWLYQQRDYGIALIKQVDCIDGTVARVANRISFIRETNFGTVFDVKAKPDTNSAAYTTLRLPLHTDLPTRELQPGLQFLHCLVNDASGGESIFVDGFKIAEHMRKHYFDEYEALCMLPMSFRNKDKDSDYRFEGPALVTNSNGVVIEVRLANFLRGPLDLPAGKVTALYRAYRQFTLLTRESQFQLNYRLEAGDLIVFDNRRVLHARNEFDLKRGGRYLQGCYVDRDELLSRIRVLERSYTI